MRVRYKTLKAILLEEMTPRVKQHAQDLLQTAVDVASEYVSSLLKGQRNSELASELDDLAGEAVGLSRWLIAKRDPRAEAYAQAAMYLKQVADASGFWKTPMFVGRNKHVEQLQSAVERARRAAAVALSGG